MNKTLQKNMWNQQRNQIHLDNISFRIDMEKNLLLGKILISTNGNQAATWNWLALCWEDL